MPLARRLQVGQERLGAVHDAPEVDVHEPLEVGIGHGLDRRSQGHPGVVEHQVDRAVLGDDLVGPRVHGVAIGDVDARARHLHARPLAEGDGLGQADVVDIAQREVRAPARQLLSERASDAGTGAGDGGHPPVEGLHDARSCSVVAVSGRAPTTAGWAAGLESSSTPSSMPPSFMTR